MISFELIAKVMIYGSSAPLSIMHANLVNFSLSSEQVKQS